MASKSEPFTFWHGLLFGEGVAAVIALPSTVVPGRTGLRNSIAELFFDQPTFMQKLLVSFVGINLILIVLLVVAFAVWWWKSRSNQGSSSGRQ